MSWHFSRALAAEYSAANCSDGELSAPLNTPNIQEKSLPQGKMTDAWKPSRYGTMLEPLTESHGAELLTWFLAGFRARESALLTQTEKDSTTPAADYGLKCGASLAKYNPDSHSLRTRQRLLITEDAELLPTLSEWGMWDAMEYWALAPLVRHIHEKECGLYATPQASDNRKVISSFGKCLRTGRNIPELGTAQGWINPELSEWLMDWPVKWTDLRPLETGKFRQWLDSHGKP